MDLEFVVRVPSSLVERPVELEIVHGYPPETLVDLLWHREASAAIPGATLAPLGAGQWLHAADLDVLAGGGGHASIWLAARGKKLGLETKVK